MELNVLVNKNPHNTDEPQICAYVTFHGELNSSSFTSEIDVRREETQIMYSLYGELAKRIEDLTIEFFKEKIQSH
jgi:hypothetical protein